VGAWRGRLPLPAPVFTMATQPEAAGPPGEGHGVGLDVPSLAKLVGLPRTARLLQLATCQRRRSPKDAETITLERYEDLLKRGRKVPDKRRNWYDKLCFWSDATTREGARIFVVAPRGPKGETDLFIDMWELLAYSVSKMHDHVVKEVKPFAIVWTQFSDHRLWPCSMWRVKDWLHPSYSRNLDAVHMVHPSWTIRAMSLFLWPVAEDEFWNYCHVHERIEFLAEFIDLTVFRLPKDLYSYDKFLDKQAQENVDQTQQRMGTMGMGMMGAGIPTNPQTEQEKEAHAQKLEELKAHLSRKGYQNKED